MSERSIVLSGIRATGRLHVGNFFGALRNFVELGKDPAHDCWYFIANWHTLTTRTDVAEMQRDLIGIVIDYLAAGLDPKVCTIYAQSSVPELGELAWLLSCVTSVNQLQALPHFREKRDTIEKSGEVVNAGLLTYPILMAADILGPRAAIVPVGQDQYPHLELARDIARAFNNRYQTDLFTLPQPLNREGVRVPSLSKAGKMGKSESADGTVFLSDDAAVVTSKVRPAVTDPARKRRSDPGDPTKCPIFTFHTLMSTPDEIRWVNGGCRSAGIGCIECKDVVIQHLNDLLGPHQERRREIEALGTDYIRDVLRDGGQKARRRIAETVGRARELAGVPTY